VPVTPSDSNDLAQPALFLYVGATGDVTVNTTGGSTQVLFKAIQAGTVLPVRASRVWSTGTSAGYIVAIF